MSQLGEALARARSSARYSQDDVGAALGINRAMVSYWESGTRTPNDRQLSALARLYSTEPLDLLEGRVVEPRADDLAGMLLRAEDEIDPGVVPGVRDFVQFLDRFAELARILGEPIRGLKQSPFVFRPRFDKKDDIRRKAEEVRAHLGLGVGPIPDLDPVCETLGITVYRAPLGPNLHRAPSGAFLNHPEVGFSILVNLDMTPGRRRFTVMHELAHALFHSDETNQVLSLGRGPRENTADAFAGEFLMPSEGIRRFSEEVGLPPRITDPIDIVHMQRYFKVSWPTALVRLRQMNAIATDRYEELRRTVRPVSLARALGYSIHPEEIAQDAERWRVQRFPMSFRRMLRQAVVTEVMSPPTAASFAGLAIPDLVQILGQPLGGEEQESPHLATEFNEFEVTGVV
ncbi:MAG: XRE family transcriptional regulator [Acidimicrobiaceae bacterium]|nr:XRE family transcriptional regulator [Acidimicrobiaceae bacterium]MCY3947597.1 XRE family transcriptional regulator [Acidimicrobiaceae bacterium]